MAGKVLTHAILPNTSSIISEMSSRQGNNAATREGYMTADLNQRHLHAKLTWRPEIVSEVTVSDNLFFCIT